MSGHIKISPASHGICDVPGFLTAGVSCDIREQKDNRLDLALITSTFPCSAAGVFTRNAVPAAGVALCRNTLRRAHPVYGVVVNSGNANAWTGTLGHRDAAVMQGLAASSSGSDPTSFLVCSTGRIGRRLPMQKVCRGIRIASAQLGDTAEHGLRAARAILTSDTHEKMVTAQFSWRQRIISVAGMAKGAGMIQPDMATMLAFIATDAGIGRSLLSRALKQGVRDSFNAITVDGDMSTNDSVLLLANGASGIRITAKQTGLIARFNIAVAQVCGRLADMIVSDGERATKVVEIMVAGTQTSKEAERIARAIGNSLLVKTSWYGSDPNWGRIADAAGYSGVAFREDQLDLFYRRHPVSTRHPPVAVLNKGTPALRNVSKWKSIVAQPRFSVILDLNAGTGAYRLLSTDLSEGYVRFNMSE